MSVAGAKSQLATALGTITWSIPTSAAAIPGLRTSFGRIETQHFIGPSPVRLPLTKFPLCRIRIPDIDETRKTSGGDLGSLKEQRIPVTVWIYFFGRVKDAQGAGDYFDAVCDATMAYFRRNSSPQPGLVTTGNNDHITSWGLRQRLNVDIPETESDLLKYRATLTVDTLMNIV